MTHRSIILGKLVLTTCGQGGAAPLLDHGVVTDSEGRTYNSRVLLLTPWRRNKYRESLPQRALVVGWRGKPVWWNRWRPKRHVVTGTPHYDGFDMGAKDSAERQP